MNKLIVIVVLLCSIIVSQAQSDNKLPQLLSDLQKSRPDTNKIRTLLRLSHYYLYNIETSSSQTNNSAFAFIQQAIKLSDSIGIEKWQQESIGYLAKYYFKIGDAKQGKAYLINIVNHFHQTGNIESELKWLHVLERNLSVYDSVGMTKLGCLEKIKGLYEQLKNEEEVMSIKLDIANVYFMLDRLNIAENEILQTLQTHKSLRGHSYNNAYYLLSAINRYKGNLNKALAYSITCVNNVEKYGDSIRIDYFFGELALVYDDLGLPKKSIVWYQKALDIRKKDPYPFIAYRTAGFLIQQLLKVKRYEEADKLVNTLSTQIPPKNDFDKINLIQVKANYYNTLKQYDKAEKFYLEMIKADGLNSNTEDASITCDEIGSFYLAIKQYDKAKEYLNKSLQGSTTEATFPRLKELHHKLFTVDSSTGDYISAIKHLNQYQILNDSIFNETKGKQIEELQIQYETEKKEQNINLLEKESKIQQSKLTEATNTRNWILVGVSLLLIIIALLYNRSLHKQRTNKTLQIQQKEISKQNQSLHHLVAEKDWLVKEIHHRVKNNFHTVIGLLATQSGYLKNEEAIDAIKDSQHRIHAMSLIHQKLYQSENLSAINMPDYIHELVDYLRDSFNIRNSIHFSLKIDRIELGLTYCIPLGLILNEAITNSIKYAFPNKEGKIFISLTQLSTHRLLLTINDNGLGLPAGFDAQTNNSMGMNLMRGLSEDIGGEFSICTNHGTTISIEFDYDRELKPFITSTTNNPVYPV